VAKKPKKEMPRDKKIAEVQIMAALAIAIMLIGAPIAVIGPGAPFIIGWIIIAIGAAILGWAFYKFAKI
jgi:amino acid transporter